MPFILRDENTTENPPLATVYGKQITAGKLAYYLKQGGRTSCILFLGDGEMEGIDRIYYRGELLPEYNPTSLTDRYWRFHSGSTTTQITPIDVTNISSDTLTLASNPYNVITVATETLTATGGTRKLTFNGQSTGNIAHNASSATIQTALEALSTIGSGNVTVTGTNPYTFTFNSSLASVASTFSVDATLLTGGTSTVTNSSEVALVAGLDPTPTAPETSVYPTGVTQHKKLYVVYSSGNDVKLSLTPDGAAITGWHTSGDENTYLETNLKVYKADAGYFDPNQGRPEFFPDIDFTFSGVAYIEVRLSAEQSEVEDEPRDFKIFVKGRKLQDFDNTGTPVGIPVYSPNNALVAVDIMLNYMKLSTTRINWESFVKFRDRCDETIVWNSGPTPTAVHPTWTFTNADTAEPFLGTLKCVNGSATPSAWTTGAKTTQTFDLTAILNKFQATYNGGHLAMGLSSAASPITWTDMKYGFHPSIITNKCYIVVDGAIYGSAHPDLTYGDRLRIEFTPTTVTWYHNDTQVHTQTPSYAGANKGAVVFSTINSQLADIKMYPIASVNRNINRFDAHVVFPSEISSITALEQVMGRAPDCHWQDVNGKIKFVVGSTFKDLIAEEAYTDGDRLLVKYLSFDPNQTAVKCNIVMDSFSSYKKPVDEKQNFLRTEFRDVEDEYYTKKYTFTDRPELRDYINYLIDFGVVQIGVASQSLSDRVSEAVLRWNTDLDLFISVKGSPDTYQLAKGDLVKFAHDVLDWTIDTAPTFIVIEETFESDSADERGFVLQIYDETYYSDTAQGPIVASLPHTTNSQLIPPPILSDLSLTESIAVMSSGSYVSSIDGIATFEPYYYQRGRVFIKSLPNFLGNIVTTDAELFTLSNGGVPSGSTPINLSGTLPVGASLDVAYYAVNVSGNDFKLSLTIGGTAIVFGSNGSALSIYNFADWEDTRIDVVPDESWLGRFSIIPANRGLNYVRVQTFSRLDVSQNFSVHYTESVNISGNITPPAAPTNLDYVYDGVTITWRFDVSASSSVDGYQVTDEFGRIIRSFITSREWFESPGSGVMIRRVYSIRNSIRSSSFVEKQFTLPVFVEWTNVTGATILPDATLKKTATTGTWGNCGAILDRAILSNEALTKVSYIIDTDDQYKIFGISSNANVNSYDDFKFAVYFHDDGTVFALWDDSGIDQEFLGSYVIGEKYCLEIGVADVSGESVVAVKKIVETSTSSTSTTLYTFPIVESVFPKYVGVSLYNIDTVFRPNLEVETIAGTSTEEIPLMSVGGGITYNETTGTVTYSGTGDDFSDLINPDLTTRIVSSENEDGTYGDAAVKFSVPSASSLDTTIGLGTTTFPFGFPFMRLRFAPAGTVKVYDYSNILVQDLGTYTGSDVWTCGRENQYVIIRKNGVLAFKHTAQEPEYYTSALFFGTSFLTTGTLNNVRLFNTAPTNSLGTSTAVKTALSKGYLGKNIVDEIPKFKVVDLQIGQTLVSQEGGFFANQTKSNASQFTLSGGQTVVTIDAWSGTILVFYRGLLESEDNYTIVGTTLTLDTAAVAGDTLRVVYI